VYGLSQHARRLERRSAFAPEKTRIPEEKTEVYRRLALFLEKAEHAEESHKEIAIGNVVNGIMASQGSNFGNLAKATGLEIDEIRYVFAGIFRREEDEIEKLKRIARALDTSLEEIEKKAAAINPNWNGGIGMLLDKLEKVVNAEPEAFRFPINIGLGVRYSRESKSINRDLLSGISHVPKPYIVILEHLLIPSEFLDPYLYKLGIVLNNTGEGFRTLGNIINDSIGGIRDNESIRSFLNRAKEFIGKGKSPEWTFSGRLKRYRKRR
jgi:hypothetical protein